jgi:hypothetical protein
MGIFCLIAIMLWAKLVSISSATWIHWQADPVREVQSQLLINCGLYGWVCTPIARLPLK